jgi:putative heme-binding domain-containing protein
LLLQQRLDRSGSKFSALARKQIIESAVAHDDITTRDLFERFLPEERRVQRLGRVIRPAALLAMKGNADTGRRLFTTSQATQCRNCHRVETVGKQVGPDLDGIGKKYGRAELLDQILNPSRKIDPKYMTYIVETKAGRVFTGLLISRTDKQVLLRDAKQKQTIIPANEIEELIVQRKSLMPELLLKDMTAQQVADLLAYLSSLKTTR